VHGYQNGEEKTCQCITSRPIDAAVAEAFLAAISPVNFRVATQVMNQIEQELVSQRRQRELQLEQARYEARLAQRQYDAVDPSNRLVAAELERRWNEKLERVTELERAFAQEEREAVSMLPWYVVLIGSSLSTRLFPIRFATKATPRQHPEP
jgi:hypothetical protein